MYGTCASGAFVAQEVQHARNALGNVHLSGEDCQHGGFIATTFSLKLHLAVQRLLARSLM